MGERERGGGGEGEREERETLTLFQLSWWHMTVVCIALKLPLLVH
jgi:hypothetical protein